MVRSNTGLQPWGSLGPGGQDKGAVARGRNTLLWTELTVSERRAHGTPTARVTVAGRRPYSSAQICTQ